VKDFGTLNLCKGKLKLKDGFNPYLKNFFLVKETRTVNQMLVGIEIHIGVIDGTVDILAEFLPQRPGFSFGREKKTSES